MRPPEFFRRTAEDLRCPPDFLRHTPELFCHTPELLGHTPEPFGGPPELRRLTPEQFYRAPDLFRCAPESFRRGKNLQKPLFSHNFTLTLNKMAKRDFLPKTQDAYVKWHDNLEAGVSANTPGLTAADVTMIAADNAALHAKMTAATTADNASKAAHADLNQTIATSQANVRKLAQRIKASTGYTTVIGDTLQLEGVDDSVDMSQQKPTLDATAELGGVVEVGFNKISAEGVHIYGMRDGDAGFTLLASETHSPYVDNRPLLAAGKPEIGLQSDAAQATARP